MKAGDLNLKLYLVFMGIYSFCYALAHFPGIETVPGYFGMTYGIIHPDSFPGDITGNFHPAMVSLFSLFVKLGGNLWLDDRFNLAAWFLIVGFSLWGVDKIIRLLGVTSALGRLAIFAVVLGYHHFIDNVPRVVDLACLRPTTYAGPFAIWISYFLLKGRSLKPLIILSVLAVLISVKNAWFPCLTVLIFIGRDYLRWTWSKILLLAVVVLTGAFLFYYIWVSFHGGLAHNVALFNWALSFEGSEANPFMNGLGPFIYVALLSAAFFIKFPDQEHTRRFKIFLGVSLAVYLCGGFYYTFAPDALKIPVLVAFAVSRSTWLPQILVFIAMGAAAVIYCQQQTSRPRKIGAAILLVLLYQFPFFAYTSFAHFFDAPRWEIDKNDLQRFLVSGVLLSGLLMAYGCVRVWPGHQDRFKLRTLQVHHLFFVVLILSSTISVAHQLNKNASNLVFLFKHGILGDTPGAKWAGVNEFIREQTPEQATILAFSGHPLRMDSSLKIRTGRTMPVGVHPGTIYFNLEKTKQNDAFLQKIQPLATYWEQCDKDRIRPILKLMHDPDYIIVPSHQVCTPESFNYQFIKEINSFTIWKRAR